MRALADQSRTILLPVPRSDQLSREFRIRHQLRQHLRQEPSVASIVKTMGVTSEKIQQLAKDTQYPLSLDMPIRFGDYSVVGDFIEDQDSRVPDDITT